MKEEAKTENFRRNLIAAIFNNKTLIIPIYFYNQQIQSALLFEHSGNRSNFLQPITDHLTLIWASLIVTIAANNFHSHFWLLILIIALIQETHLLLASTIKARWQPYNYNIPIIFAIILCVFFTRETQFYLHWIPTESANFLARFVKSRFGAFNVCRFNWKDKSEANKYLIHAAGAFLQAKNVIFRTQSKMNSQAWQMFIIMLSSTSTFYLVYKLFYAYIILTLYPLLSHVIFVAWIIFIFTF